MGDKNSPRDVFEVVLGRDVVKRLFENNWCKFEYLPESIFGVGQYQVIFLKRDDKEDMDICQGKEARRQMIKDVYIFVISEASLMFSRGFCR